MFKRRGFFFSDHHTVIKRKEEGKKTEVINKYYLELFIYKIYLQPLISVL